MTKEISIRVTRDYVLLELYKKDNKTVSGIFTAPQGKVEFNECALVVGVGPLVKTVAVGEEVLFDGSGSYHYQMGDRDYLIVTEHAIYAVGVTPNGA